MLDPRPRVCDTDMVALGSIEAVQTTRTSKMKRTLHAVFDGKVFRPREPLDLAPDRDYVLTVESEEATEPAERDPENLVEFIASLAVHTGIPDLAHEHDHYLYGTPKRGKSG